MNISQYRAPFDLMLFRKLLNQFVESKQHNWKPITKMENLTSANHGSSTGDNVTSVFYYNDFKNDFVTSKEQAFQGHVLRSILNLIDMPREIVETTKDAGEKLWGIERSNRRFITCLLSVFIYLFVWGILYGSFFLGNRLKHITEWTIDGSTAFAGLGFVLSLAAVAIFVLWRVEEEKSKIHNHEL